MARIAFTHAFCWPEVRRGAERFIQELGAGLAARGHEVTILSAGWAPATSVLDGVTTMRLRRRRTLDHAHEADFGRRVLPRLLAGRFDVVHSMGRRDAVASIRAALVHPRRRTVITDLGLPSRWWWESVGPTEARAVERVVRGIDVYSCMSQFALDHLARDYGRTDGIVIPGGVDLATFVPAAARAPEPVLLFSGAITEPRKGVADLLRAVPLIAREEPAVRVWLSGPGDVGPLLAAAPPEGRDRVEVLGVGEADRQHERYGAAWATCLPSVDDSFGMALIESLACGTPLVTTTQGAPPELVVDGVTGSTCAPGDIEGLAAACLRVLALARKASTVDACRRSVEPFDWRSGLAPYVERVYAGETGLTAPGVSTPRP